MATKTRDIVPVVKGKRSPSTSKTRSPAHTNAINLIASNRKNTYLKSKGSSSPDKTPGKKPTYANILQKQTLNNSTLMDRSPFNLDNTQVKKNPTSSNDLNIVHNKPSVARGSFFDNRPSPPSSFDNAQGKKLASSSCFPPSIHNKQTLAGRRLSFDNRPFQSCNLDRNTHGKKVVASSTSDSNIQNKQTLAGRRLSFDHKLPPSSFHEKSPQSRKLVQKSDQNIHRKQAPTPRRLSIDHKPPLASHMLKNRISSNPKERIPKPPIPSSSKNSTSQKPLLNILPKTPQTTTKDVIGKQHGDVTEKQHEDVTGKQHGDVTGKQHSAGLYAKALNMNKTITKEQDSPAGLTTKESVITSNLTDVVVSNIDPHVCEELEKEELQELAIEDDGELSETVNIDEYLKAAESSSLYVAENQEAIKIDAPEEQQQVEETSIIKLEETKNVEPSNLDLEETDKQEHENQQEKEQEKGEESETPLKALDDCQQKKEEEKELDLKIEQDEKKESEGRNNKEKEVNNTKTSTNTMAFAKAYPYSMNKKESSSVSSNDVIEETASKLREQRKNRVKALASAFETVISLQDPK